ncbi:MAG: AAA family ATPase [Candidatus Cryptobacteroides sp.]|nr:AAA family ATPase [Bacteroidales bacterium]MDD7133346.1 AAA family ATPase [Bacteroidales bacterium]MDY2773408.1 AAA family ATPase [Candidatus Cryptobacteroides sp.]
MSERIFKRKLYETMLKWKSERNGSTALLIKGARRVGKSTLAEEFAKNEYESYILIDFVECKPEVKDLFIDISDLNKLFFRLQFLYDVQLKERKSVIIFDEVQNCPSARQAIKKLVKDGRYDYIETGSLLSIKKNIKDIRIPSEETRLTLYPMDFEEFYWARGNEITLPMLRDAWNQKTSLGDAVNRKIMDDLRLYMLVGGMPQAVDSYLETNNLSMVDAVKREIIELYADDFRKIDTSGKATSLFYAIPAQLTGNAARYQVGSVVEDGKVDRLSETLQDMEDSMVVLISRHANDPSVGLSLHRDIEQFKMYVADTGLMITMAFWDKSVTENEIYQKLLTDKLPVNLGYVYENLVAQMLKASGNELFYHTWPTENRKHNYEIDFLLSRGTKLCPIEVKSSGYTTHKSLDAFCEKFSSRIGARYLLYTKDLRKDGQTTCVPVYMTELI